MVPELIYCADGTIRTAQIAIDAGFSYGAQLPRTIYFPIRFADQNWKNPNRAAYMAALAQHRPHMASVLDLERVDQLGEVLGWAENAAAFCEVVMIIPKAFGVIDLLPRIIGGAEVRLGFSVPTRFGGTEVPPWEFSGWPVHLLGGSPHTQMKLAHYMDARSVDGNLANRMAMRHCAFYDPTKRTRSGYWPSIALADGVKWRGGGADADAPYEAFRRSCAAIAAMWRRA